MRKLYISSIFILFINSIVIGQNDIKISVTDEQSNSIAYCEIYINGKTLLLADSTGTVSINRNNINLGDLILIKALGYKTQEIKVNEPVLNSAGKKVIMKETNYQIDEIAVSSKDFNALKFFKKRKRAFLFPYGKKHVMHASARCSYKQNGEYVAVSDSFNILYKLGTIDELYGNKNITDTTVLSFIRQAVEQSVNKSIIYNLPKYRKLLDFKYNGISDDKYVFEAVPNKKFYNKFKESKGDNWQMLIYMDSDGYITNDKSRYVCNSDLGFSYNLSTDYYTNKHERMMPAHISMTIFISESVGHSESYNLDWGSEVHIEMECRHE